jgi:hypothetical protein
MLVRSRSLTGRKWLLLLLISAAFAPGAFATEEEPGQMPPCLTIGEVLVQSGRVMDALCIAPVWKAGLWIRIHFFLIRIQSLMLETNTDPDPIRILGCNDQKLKKNNG